MFLIMKKVVKKTLVKMKILVIVLKMMKTPTALELMTVE